MTIANVLAIVIVCVKAVIRSIDYLGLISSLSSTSLFQTTVAQTPLFCCLQAFWPKIFKQTVSFFYRGLFQIQRDDLNTFNSFWRRSDFWRVCVSTMPEPCNQGQKCRYQKALPENTLKKYLIEQTALSM